jgi:flagellar biosynthesis protein FliR
MTPALQDLIFAGFIIFCRLASCLMVAPGMSSQHIPARARLLIALACTYALFPLLVGNVFPIVSTAGFSDMVRLIVSESLVGLLIGLCGRVFFLALEFAGTAVTSFLNFSAMPGVPLEDTEQSSSFSALINMSALVLVFISDLHVELLKGLIQSYGVIGVKFEIMAPQAALRQLTAALLLTFDLALRLISPFLLYSIIANLLFGLANKLLPQIPVYFISAPFIIAGGLGLCILVTPECVSLFTSVYSRWVITGSL